MPRAITKMNCEVDDSGIGSGTESLTTWAVFADSISPPCVRRQSPENGYRIADPTIVSPIGVTKTITPTTRAALEDLVAVNYASQRLLAAEVRTRSRRFFQQSLNHSVTAEFPLDS
jgi:hypothetical protein